MTILIVVAFIVYTLLFAGLVTAALGVGLLSLSIGFTGIMVTVVRKLKRGIHARMGRNNPDGGHGPAVDSSVVVAG